MGRPRVIFLAGGIAAVVALLLLSGSLSQVRLAPGDQLPSVAQETGGLELGDGAAVHLLDEAALERFLKVIYILVPLLLAASIVALIISPEMRKDVLARLIVPILLLLYLLLIRDKQSNVPLAPTSAVPVESGAAVVAEEGPIVEFSATPPDTVVWGTRIAVGVGVALLVGGALWLLWRSRRAPAPHPLAQVAEQARQAIRAIEAGGDVRNVILRCYFEMGRILGEEKGLLRQSTMTPREFECSLTAAGLPGPAVRRLTRLFEGVRYGAKPTGAREEQEAMLALVEISDACRGGA